MHELRKAFGVLVALAMSLLAGCSRTTDERVGRLFAQIPEDTPYLMANTRDVPEAFYRDQLQKMQQLLGENPGPSGPGKGSTPGERFLSELWRRVGEKAAAGDLESIGLRSQARSVIYGNGLLPVFRTEISDPGRFKKLVDDTAQHSGITLPWKKCGQFDCFWQEGPKTGLGGILVLTPRQLVAALYGRGGRQAALDHLLGHGSPARSYTPERFQAFLEKNGYSGQGAGFVRLEPLARALVDSVQQELKTRGKGRQAARLAGCGGAIEAVVKHVPRLLFGVKEIEQKRVKGEVVLETSPVLAQALGGLPAPLDGLQLAKNPVMDFGVSLDIPHLRDRLIDLFHYLGQVAGKGGCDALDPEMLKRASMGVGMAMGLGVSQLKGLYFAVEDVGLDPQGAPRDLSLRLSIAADDPDGLLRMGAVFLPALASIRLPENGQAVPLAAGMLPPGAPPVRIARKGHFLHLIVGDEKPGALHPVEKGATPALLWGGMDGRRYYTGIAALAGKLPASTGKKGRQWSEVLDALRTMGDMAPTVSQRIYPDSRGLVADLDIRYP